MEDRRASSPALWYTLGSALIVLGAASLVVAVIAFQGDPVPAAGSVAAEPTDTATPATEAIQQPSPTASAPATGPTTTPGPTPTPTPTPVPTETEQAAPTETATLAIATPTSTPTATATATEEPPPAAVEPTPAPTEPSQPPATATSPATGAPALAISGPASVEVGEPATFIAMPSGDPEPFTVLWAWSGGTVNHDPAPRFTFAEPGCYLITLFAFYPDGDELQAQHVVAAGDAVCAPL